MSCHDCLTKKMDFGLIGVRYTMPLGVRQVLFFFFYRSSQDGFLSHSAFQQFVVMKVALNILKLDKRKIQLNCKLLGGGGQYFQRNEGIQ